MTTPAHRLLDHLLDDLKKELFAKMQQNVVLELEKRKRDLQSMVENMLEERRTEMLKVLRMKQSTPTPTTLRRHFHTQRFQDQNQSRTTYFQIIEQNCIAIHIIVTFSVE